MFSRSPGLTSSECMLSSLEEPLPCYEVPKFRWTCPVKQWNGFQKVLADDPGVFHKGSSGLPKGHAGECTWVILMPCFIRYPWWCSREKLNERERLEGLALICACPIPGLPTCPVYPYAEGRGYSHMINEETKAQGCVETWPRSRRQTLQPSHLPLPKAVLGFWAQKSLDSLVLLLTHGPSFALC